MLNQQSIVRRIDVNCTSAKNRPSNATICTRDAHVAVRTTVPFATESEVQICGTPGIEMFGGPWWCTSKQWRVDIAKELVERVALVGNTCAVQITDECADAEWLDPQRTAVCTGLPWHAVDWQCVVPVCCVGGTQPNIHWV